MRDETLERSDWRTWLMSGLFTIAIMTSGAVFLALSDRVDRLEREGSAPMRERLAGVEARQGAQQRQLDSDVRDVRETVKDIKRQLEEFIKEERAPQGRRVR